MRCAIRVDASHRIGSGHVMRCLTLAGALRDRGDSVTFVTRKHLGHMVRHIEEAGHPVLCLEAPPAEGRSADPDDHRSWLGVAEEDDAEEVLRVLDGKGPLEWLIADHYAVGERWESALRERAGSIAVFDDLADRQHDVDVLVDQTAGRRHEEYRPLVPDHAQLLLGPMYAPLRPEFARLRRRALARRRADPQPQRLLVMMGGFDPDHATSLVLDRLGQGRLPASTRLEVIMGPSAPALERVRAIASDMPWPTTVVVGVSDIAERMAAADLAIGAAGTTSWERCCLGLPSLVMTIAENQSRIAEEIAQAGAAIHVGQLHDNRGVAERVSHEAARLLCDPPRLLAMSEAAADLVDGRGAERLTRVLRDEVAE